MSEGGKVFLVLAAAGAGVYALLSSKSASAATPATPPGGQTPQGQPPGLALPGLPGLTAPLQIPGTMPPVPSIPSTDSNIHASQESLYGARTALRTLPADVSALCADQWMLAQPSTSGALGALANWLQANGKQQAAQWMAKRANEALNIAAYPVAFTLYYDPGLTPQVRARLHSALLRQEWEELQGLIEQIRPAAPKTAAGFEAQLPDYLKQGAQKTPTVAPSTPPGMTGIPGIPPSWLPGQNPPPPPPPPPATTPPVPGIVPPTTTQLPAWFPSIPGVTPPPGMTPPSTDKPGQPGGLPPGAGGPPTAPPSIPPGAIPGIPPGIIPAIPGVTTPATPPTPTTIPASYTPPGGSTPPPSIPKPGQQPPPKPAPSAPPSWWPAGVPFVAPPGGETPAGSAPPGMVLPANASWDASSNRIKYIVQPGDTGTKIAQRFGKGTPALWAPSVVAANPGKKWGKDGNVHPGNAIWLQPAFGIPGATPPVSPAGSSGKAPAPSPAAPPPASNLPGPDYRWERKPDGTWHAVKNIQA